MFVPTATPLDFLLDCIGFPPSHDFPSLARHAEELGHPVAWRGPGGLHRSLAVAPGVAVHVDREEHEHVASLSPFALAEGRLRVAVEALRPSPDSPCDTILHGRLLQDDDLVAGDLSTSKGLFLPAAHAIDAVLADGRLLPRHLPHGHVLALTLAGFGIHVEALEPDRSSAAHYHLAVLEGSDVPAGCIELSARIVELATFTNELAQAPFHRAVVALGPERDPRTVRLALYLIPWQLFDCGLRASGTASKAASCSRAAWPAGCPACAADSAPSSAEPPR